MLIIGAGGLAKQMIEDIESSFYENIAFFDDITKDSPDFFYNKYKIVKSMDEAKSFLKNTDSSFSVCISGTKLREQMAKKFQEIGGKLTSVISRDCHIGKKFTILGNGLSILQGVIIENSVTIGDGCLFNLGSIICHDSVIGNYCEICPGVRITGRCKIDSYCFIGTGAILLPDIHIGTGAVIGAGAVVTKNVMPNETIVGIPGRAIL
jgi:sugar O-acyltransferase (sialic acid O-acetyltransferase NeuD family)